MIPEQTVYVVRSGIYSGKTWHGIFTTREKAEALVKELMDRQGCFDCARQREPDSGDPHVEEWTLDKLPELPEGVYEVTIKRDGTIDDVEFNEWRTEVNPAREGWPSDTFTGYGRTREEARRSAEELRRVVIVNPHLTDPPNER